MLEKHEFGGQWTEDKLQILAKYLAAYGKVMSNQTFTTAYIDAFAGVRYWTNKQAIASAKIRESFAATQTALDLEDDDLGADDPRKLREGSALRALQVEPRFDRYIFIEKQPARVHDLEQLKEQFPALAPDILIHTDDANHALVELTKANWKRHRAVLFLDPYGMTVDWSTIEAIARTKAIDMWLLFPLGSALNRMLTRSGTMPEPWERKLTAFLGTDAWRDELYRPTPQASLFANATTERNKASLKEIEGYFVQRLKSIFPHVAKPGVLRNSQGGMLFLLCFAAANEKGGQTAIKIAEHLLKPHR